MNIDAEVNRSVLEQQQADPFELYPGTRGQQVRQAQGLHQDAMASEFERYVIPSEFDASLGRLIASLVRLPWRTA